MSAAWARSQPDGENRKWLTLRLDDGAALHITRYLRRGEKVWMGHELPDDATSYHIGTTGFIEWTCRVANVPQPSTEDINWLKENP